MTRAIPGLWGHRKMRPAERRLYAAFCEAFARMACRCAERERLRLLEATRWQDDGGATT